MADNAEGEDTAMVETCRIDRDELETLRRRLLELGPDYTGASQVIQAFLNGLGYGISPESARNAALEFGVQGCSLDSIGKALDRVARVA